MHGNNCNSEIQSETSITDTPLGEAITSTVAGGANMTPLDSIETDLHLALKAETKNFIEIGQILIRARDEVGLGFVKWLKANQENFGLSVSTAYNYIRAAGFAAEHDPEFPTVGNLAPVALYWLSGVTDKAVIGAVLAEARQHRLSLERAQQIALTVNPTPPKPKRKAKPTPEVSNTTKPEPEPTGNAVDPEVSAERRKIEAAEDEAEAEFEEAADADETTDAMPPPKRSKPQSRSAHWQDAASRAVQALEELQDLRADFESWRDNLPENLKSSSLGEKLEAVCDLDLDSALGIAQEAEEIDLPLGFGRD